MWSSRGSAQHSDLPCNPLYFGILDCIYVKIEKGQFLRNEGGEVHLRKSSG